MARRNKIPFSVTNYQVSIWPLCMLAEMLSYHFHKLAGVAYPSEKVGEWQNRTNRWAIDVAGYDQVARAILQKIEKNPKWAWRMAKKIPQVCEDFLKFTRGIFRADLKNKTDRELYDFYMGYRRRYIETYMYCWLPNALEGMSSIFTKKLEQYLISRFRSNAPIGEYLSVLTTPLKNSFRQKEEQDFLRILARCKVGTAAFDCAIVRHAKKYCWLPFDYDGPAWDKTYFLDRARSLTRQKIDPRKKLAEMESERKKLAIRQKAYARAIVLDKDPHYGYLFQLARELMYLKDYRKDVLFQSYWHMDKLIGEIGRRLGLTAIQVKHILPSEMKDALIRRRYSADELNERIRYCVLVYDKKGIRLFTGKQAREIVRTRVKPEPRVENVRELHGECAYAGKAKGVARLIFEPKDMAKMREGNILVSVATNPNLLPAMCKAGAIVTDKGGITSHAAIISREMKMPCVIGTKIATRVFKDGDRVEVDAQRGVVRKIVQNSHTL